MKDIRIFVASSKELLPERNALAYFVLAHEDEFAKRGLRVRLSKWEYVDPTMTEERTEDRYLDEMLNCDAVLMLFRHVLGKYTKEEVDKAIATEIAGTSRIKRHLILFKEGDADESSELAVWRASLAEDTYGMFTDAGGLGAHFLRLVEQIAGLPLQDVADAENEKTISAFLAVDDELAVDRDAFADAVLNLNDVLSHRGARVRLRFYDPEQHRDMLDNSEMALVLYQTKCGAFGTSALKESYDRAKEEKNPKRLYVFFRDAAGKPLDADFQTFKDGFAEAFGSSPCLFENVDTLSLNFLFALESVLGDGAGTFVKLDGRTVVADGLEVGDLTELPMLKKNAGLTDLFTRMKDVSKRFVVQREKCDKNPQDDGLYVELLDLSAEKNRLQDQIDRELKMSFNLAKRLAAISIAQVNETIARARAKVEEGDIKGALEILDGASSVLKRRRLLHKAADRAEAEELQIKELKASAEIEYFRVDAVMAYTAMPFEERFKKAVSICETLVNDLQSFSEVCTVRNSANSRCLLANALRRFARLYDGVSDTEAPMLLWERELAIRRRLASDNPAKYLVEVATSLKGLADVYNHQSRFGQAEEGYKEALEIRRQLASEIQLRTDANVATILGKLAGLHGNVSRRDDAKKEFAEALEIRRRLAERDPAKYNSPLATLLRERAVFLGNAYRFSDAEKECQESLAIFRRLAKDDPTGYDPSVAASLKLMAYLHEHLKRLEEAEEEYNEALSIRRRLANDNPARYGRLVADTLRDFALLERDMNKLAESEQMYLESGDIYRRQAEANPREFGDSQIKTSFSWVTAGQACGELVWTTGGRKSWFGEDVKWKEGVDETTGARCLVSGAGGAGDAESCLRTNIEGPCVISFEYQVQTYEGCFRVTCGGTDALCFVGVSKPGSPWRPLSFDVPSGRHPLVVSYRHPGRGYSNQFNGARIRNFKVLKQKPSHENH